MTVGAYTAGSAVEHAFSHFDLVIHPLAVRVEAEPDTLMDRDGWLWYNPAQEQRVGIAAPIAVLLNAQNHAEEMSP